MLFICQWTLNPEDRNEAIKRFLETGGKPPEGVALLGRWFIAGQSAGFAVLESDSPVALQQFALEWNDLLHMEISPALTDEQAGPLMAAAVSH